MTKERRTVSLDEDNDEYLDQDQVNASGLVNKLVKNYRTGGGGDEAAMLRLREDQLKSEIADLEARLETKQSDLQHVQEQLTAFEDSVEDVIAQASDVLEPHVRTADNPAVEKWAADAGLPPEDFLDRLDTFEEGE